MQTRRGGFSVLTLKKSEDECLTETGREFQITGLLYWKALPPRVPLPILAIWTWHGTDEKENSCNTTRHVQTDQNPVAAVKLSQEQRDVTKHDEIADEDGHNVRVALPVQLILNGTLQSVTTSQAGHLKFYRNYWVIHWKYPSPPKKKTSTNKQANKQKQQTNQQQP